MRSYHLAICSLSAIAVSSVAHGQISSNNFDFNQVTQNTYYYGAEVNAENDEFFVRNRYQDVAFRWQQGYNPLSVRLGAFEALPALLTGATVTDNLFLDNQNEISDVGFEVEPSVTLQSTWSRHKLGFDARVNHTEFIDTSSESATVGGARIFGGLDLTSSFNISGSGSFQNSREPRVSVGGLLAAIERVETNRFGGELNSIYQRNRIKLRARFSYNDFDFDDVELIDGTFADQDFRDFAEIRTAVRGDYAVTRDWSIATEVEYIDRSADNDVVGFLDRNVDGIAVRAGANFELPQNLRGDILVGYQSFNSSSPGVENIDGVSVRADLTWFPTELTTVNLGAGRDVEDAGAVNAASVLVTRANLNVSHEFRRNLVAFARVGFRDLDFEPIDFQEDEFNVGVGGTWKINDNVHLTMNYGFTTRDSIFQPFDENRGTIALRFFP